ncbi:hypothetical protein KY332_00005 [Candidatus Woesearchaeota archaeon]|nr:hypothetical protein [Candidatus Woesearchaeota archaeon]
MINAEIFKPTKKRVLLSITFIILGFIISIIFARIIVTKCMYIPTGLQLGDCGLWYVLVLSILFITLSFISAVYLITIIIKGILEKRSSNL